MMNGLNDSRLSLNRYFSTIDKWAEDEIVKRCEKLSEIFNLVYAYPYLDEELLESYKTREIERIFYFDNHKEVYEYLIDRLDLVNVRKSVFSNRVVFDNYQIKFNKKSIMISDSEDDEVHGTFRNKNDVDRFLKSMKKDFLI